MTRRGGVRRAPSSPDRPVSDFSNIDWRYAVDFCYSWGRSTSKRSHREHREFAFSAVTPPIEPTSAQKGE